jgi:hypothetical protein
MKCQNHEDSDSVGNCYSCGREMCAICRIFYKGYPYCKECIEAGMALVTSQVSPRHDASSYFNMVCDRLYMQGYDIYSDKISGHDTVVAYNKHWYFGNQMNTFVLMVHVVPLTDIFVEQFSKLALEYAITYNQGLPRGMSMVFALPLYASTEVEAAAKFRVMERPRFGISSFAVPSIFDLTEGKLYSIRNSPMYAWLLHDFHRRLIWRAFPP